MTLRNLLFTALLLITITTTVGAQYFVSVTGSDTNAGTLAQPFKTIQKAADTMLAGDTCFIMEGVYHETITPANSGTVANHLTFKNYENDKVIVVGTDSVSGWVPYQNGIYKAYAPDTVLQLCVDKQMANEARYPNFNGNHLSTVGWKSVTIDTNSFATFTGMNFPAGYWVGGWVEALVQKRWVCQNGLIDSSGANKVRCSKTSWPWGSHPAYGVSSYVGSGVGYITHHLSALDTINEWHWQNDTLYYYPQNAAQIATINAQARTRMYGLDCRGKQYIDIININFVWATLNFENASGCTVNGGSVFYPTPQFFFNNAWDRQAHDSLNYGITSWQGKGVALSGNGNTLINCYIAHSWGDGISMGGQNNTVANCLVEDCNWSATDDAVLCTVGTGHNITYSTLRNAARCILVNRLSNLTDITNCDMYDCGFITQDLGVTYSYHSNGGGSQIAYNLVHDNHSTSSSMGIYLDNYDTAYVVHHNVIWNCINAIQTNMPAVNHQIYNNTAWFCTNAMGAWGNAGTTIQNQIVKNNLSNKPWNQGNTFSNNLVSANPQFTSAANKDFTLTATSPAINAGVIITGITDGYIGAAPDAGAYEYGATPWTTGSSVTVPDVSEVLSDSSQTTAIFESNKSAQNGFAVYPNPTTSILHINYNDLKNTLLIVYDVYGKKIFEQKNCTTVNLSTSNKGLYLIELTDTVKNVSYTKVVVLQ